MTETIPGKRYTTAEGDMVDLICFNRYGQTKGTVELVLDTNWGLAEYGPILPAGLEIILPSFTPAPPRRSIVWLWS